MTINNFFINRKFLKIYSEKIKVYENILDKCINVYLSFICQKN